jgi:dihydroflavonol-4-reductase
MKAFVTGGTGFIGSHVVKKLVARGHDVNGLARSTESADELRRIGVTPVDGTILDKESMREGMRGADVVFHIAGWYKLGAYDQAKGREINVTGTQNTLELAYELGVPRIIYTSSLVVFGDTHGQIVNEGYLMPPEQEFLNQYDHTKWEAHYQIVQPLIKSGAPIVIVMPGAVYGPGDESLVGSLMKWFFNYPMPIFPTKDMALTFVHVEDIAEGHLLAAERGAPGESYVLSGPALYLPELVKLWARITNRPEPLVYLPSWVMKPLAPVAALLELILPAWPDLLSRDAIAILDATYIASSAKAEKNLGWKTRDLEIGMRETFDWIGMTSQPFALTQGQRSQISISVIGAALGLLLVWMLIHRRKDQS